MNNKLDSQEFIFVFGSNLLGIHGKGAAYHAARYFDAKHGHGEGLTGRAYALPTVFKPRKPRPLSDVAESAERFKTFAASRRDLTFMVTRAGCGLAGFSDEQISPFFMDAPKNCLLPGVWEAKRRPEPPVRLIISGALGAGPSAITHLDRLTEPMRERGTKIELVIASAADLKTTSMEWAEQHGFDVTEFRIDRSTYGNAAESIRNQDSCWYGTHLIAFDPADRFSPDSRHMIEIAKTSGIVSRVVRFADADTREAPGDIQTIPAH